MINEKTKNRNLEQKDDKKLLNKKINSYTLERLMQHNNKRKIEPANKMIAEYYARRDKEMQAAKARQEEANRNGIYNFSMAKYDNIFKTVNQPRKISPKQLNLNVSNLKNQKTITVKRFSPEALAKKNGINIKKENDNRPVIDLFDENNTEKQPTIIVYDPVKGIYVMEEPKNNSKKTLSEPNLRAKITKQGPNVKNDDVDQKYNMPPKEVNNDETKQKAPIIKQKNSCRPVTAEVIDPNKKPTSLSAIKPQTNEQNEFKQTRKSNNDELNKPQQAAKINKKQSLLMVKTNQKEENLHLPSYYQTNYSSRRGFSSFWSKVFRIFKITKWTHKAKRWDK